jgi:Fe-S oxidoreductase, related to NifB/MoaA family
MRKNGHIITKIKENSIALELELEVGDSVIAVNNSDIEDVFDYEYLVQDEYVELTVIKQNGEEWILEIDKEYNEDIGIEFENGLMDNYKSCRNKCMFCFIDQLPKGMRETLYFKDDDSRLSFLQGNYVTLTNMSEKDIERIIKYKLSPINISVHTTNPVLRCKMLNNRFAGEALAKLDRLYEAKTPMNGQIVLCKGVNDSEELKQSLEDLMKYQPYMQSVSVVPVGLSKYRKGLYQLEPFTKKDAIDIIEIIEDVQNKSMLKYGNHFIHASDEIYILAEKKLPSEESYDNYIQLENGVGMITLLRDEVKEVLSKLKGDNRKIKSSIATGKLAYPYICELIELIKIKFPNITVNVYFIENDFFGEQITVTGLITGTDIISQLTDKDLGEFLNLSMNMFMSEKEIFLDDLTKSDVQNALQVHINIVKSSGYDFVKSIIERKEENNSAKEIRYKAYELPLVNKV